MGNTTQRFLDILESMTHVEILHLQKVSLLVPVVSEILRVRTVFLPRLRSLTLASGPYLPSTRILNSLHLPIVTFASLTVDVSDEDPEGIVAALPQDRSLVFPMLSAITSVEVSEQDYDEVYGLRGINPAKSLEVAVDIEPMFGGDVDWSFSLARVLADSVDFFSHSPITELAISGQYSRMSVSEWMDVLYHFPLLETIHLKLDKSESTHTFWMALSETPRSSEGRGALCCPRLRTVNTIGPHSVPSMGPSAFWAMPRALRIRKDRGHPLERSDLYLGYEGDEDCLRRRDTAYLAQVEECVGMLVVGLLSLSLVSAEH
ncbi:hypothetical protein C8T65DRAFT_170503 [Cerioporus squamosus]|nr:hypothetical protein C8T65DRAFT_170503 [Cerioporus squamosus]